MTLLAPLSQTLSHDGTAWMVAGSVVAGVAAYLFQVVGARALGSAGYAAISVLWTVQYLLSSVVFVAVESYVVRTVTVDGGHLDRLRRTGRPLLVTLAGLSLALGVAAQMLRGRAFPGHIGLAVVVPALVVAYGWFVIVRGVLAARGRYKAYGGVTALESVLRLALAAAVLLTAARPETLAWTLPAGALGAATWGLFVLPRRKRLSDDREAGAPLAAGRFLLYTTTANGLAQFLLAGGPLVLVGLNAPTTDITMLFITVTAARVPLVIVQGGLLSRLLPSATRLAGEDPRRLARYARLLGLAVAAAAATTAGLAWAAGPTLLSLLFGTGIAPSPRIVACVGAGVVLATGASLLNQLVIATGRERALVAPWAAALGAGAIVMFVLPGSDIDRVCLAFVVGEVVAAALLVRLAVGHQRQLA